MVPCFQKFTQSCLPALMAIALALVFGFETFSPASAEPLQVAKAPGEVTVKLLDAGTSPRRALRFSPAKGATQTSVMTMDMQIAMSVAGQPMPRQKMPAQKMTMQIVADDVLSNGDISYRFEYTEMEVIDDPNNPSPLTKTIQDALTPMIGMSGAGVTTNRGFAKSAELNIPEGAPPMIKQILDGMKDAMKRLSSPVPEEPIGLGGKWEVVQDVSANGMVLTQTSVHELTDLTDQGFTMSAQVTQSAEPQEVKNPALPANIKVMLDSLKTTGSGTSNLGIDLIMPLSSSVTVNSETSMTMELAGQKQKMDTTTNMTMTLESP